MAHPIDTGWSWMCTLGCGVCLFWVNGGIRSFSILLPEFGYKYEVSRLMLSMMMGIIAVTMSLIAPVASILGHAYTYRAVLMTGGFLCSIALFLAAFAPNYTFILCVFAVLTGIGYGCVFAPCMVVISQYFNKRLALANGLAMSGGSLGMLIVPLLFQLLLDTYGLYGCLLVMSACTLNMIPATALLRPISFYGEQKPPTVSTATSNQQGSVPNNSLYMDVCESYDANNTSDTYLIQQRESRHFSDSTEKDADLTLLDDGEANLESSADCRGTASSPNIWKSNVTVTKAEPPKDTNTDIEVATKQCNGLKTQEQSISKRQSLQVDVKQASDNGCCFLMLLKQRHVCTSIMSSCDFSLFKHYLFLLYVAGMSLSSAGWGCAGLFLVAHTTEIGMSNTNAVMLVSIWGVADFITRPVIGWFSDLKLIRLSYIFAISMFIGGCATGVLVYIPASAYAAIIVLSSIIGLSVGVYSALYAPLLTQFIGPARLHYAFGMCILVQGVFNMLIPPLLGFIRDSTGDYQLTYLICAGLMISSGLLFLAEPIVSKWQAADDEQNAANVADDVQNIPPNQTDSQSTTQA